MNTQELAVQLDKEYEKLLSLSREYFNKWIETGEDTYKEKELLHTGAAHAMITIKKILQGNA